MSWHRCSYQYESQSLWHHCCQSWHSIHRYCSPSYPAYCNSCSGHRPVPVPHSCCNASGVPCWKHPPRSQQAAAAPSVQPAEPDTARLRQISSSDFSSLFSFDQNTSFRFWSVTKQSVKRVKHQFTQNTEYILSYFNQKIQSYFLFLCEFTNDYKLSQIEPPLRGLNYSNLCGQYKNRGNSPDRRRTTKKGLYNKS